MTSEDKLARNEALFRDINETIEKTAIENRYEPSELPVFVCECADTNCGDLIRLSLTQYEDVRRHPTHFFLVPGHEDPQIERVVERYESYFVVEKVGVGRETAHEVDPRAPGGPDPAGPP